MPTPATTAGLVLGAVLGTGALCLGAYFVHRYMDLQCQKIKRWFQRDAVGRKKYDVESGGKYKAERVNAMSGKKRKQRSRAAISQGDGYENRNQRHTPKLRGGNGYAERTDDAERMNEKHMQSYKSLSVSNHGWVGQPQAIGCNYHTWPHEHMGYSPAWHCEVPPQSAVYVAPYPGLIVYPETAFTQPPLVDLNHVLHHTAYVDPQYRSNLDALRAEVRSRPRPRERLPVRAQMEPTTFESDCIEVIVEHPRIADNARKQKGKEEKHSVNDTWRQRPSSEESTCSSSQDLSSIEDVPRESIPSGAPRYVRLPTRDCPSYPQYPKRPAKVWGDADQYARRSQHDEGRQGRSNTDSMRWGRRRQSGANDGRQASRAVFISHTQDNGSSRGDLPEACQREREGSVQSGNTVRDCIGMKTTDGKARNVNGEDRRRIQGGMNEASGHRERPAGPVSSTRSKPYYRLATAAVGSALSDVVTEEPSSDTATVGTKGKTGRQPHLVVDGSAFDAPTSRSRGRIFLSVSHADSTRGAGPSAPASSLDDTMSLPWMDRSAGGRAGQDGRWSVSSAEASFHIDERN